MEEPTSQIGQDSNSPQSPPMEPSTSPSGTQTLTDTFVIKPQPPKKIFLPKFSGNLKKALPLLVFLLLIAGVVVGSTLIKQRYLKPKANTGNCTNKHGWYCEDKKILNCTGETQTVKCQQNRCRNIDTRENCLSQDRCDVWEAYTDSQTLNHGEWSSTQCIARDAEKCSITQADWVNNNGNFLCGENFKRNCPDPYVCPTTTPGSTNTPTFLTPTPSVVCCCHGSCSSQQCAIADVNECRFTLKGIVCDISFCPPCNLPCQLDNDCANGYYCMKPAGLCRKASCPLDEDCDCFRNCGQTCGSNIGSCASGLVCAFEDPQGTVKRCKKDCGGGVFAGSESNCTCPAQPPTSQNCSSITLYTTSGQEITDYTNIKVGDTIRVFVNGTGNNKRMARIRFYLSTSTPPNWKIIEDDNYDEEMGFYTDLGISQVGTYIVEAEICFGESKDSCIWK